MLEIYVDLTFVDDLKTKEIRRITLHLVKSDIKSDVIKIPSEVRIPRFDLMISNPNFSNSFYLMYTLTMFLKSETYLCASETLSI